MRNCVQPIKEHKYLQVLTKESQPWKFHFSENPSQAPSVAVHRGFDDEGWSKIRVPSSWECEGYGQAVYTNFQYPFKCAPPVVSPLMNHVGSYQTYVVVPASWQNRKVLPMLCVCVCVRARARVCMRVGLVAVA